MICTRGNCPVGWRSIPGRVIPKTQKMALDAASLNTQYYKLKVRVKWNNPGKGVAPSSILRCNSYWKGNLRVALDYGCQLYLYSYLIQIICKQLYGFKYSYLIQMICKQLYGFKYSYLIQIICTQLYGFKYFYQSLMIIWFQDIISI